MPGAVEYVDAQTRDIELEAPAKGVKGDQVAGSPGRAGRSDRVQPLLHHSLSSVPPIGRRCDTALFRDTQSPTSMSRLNSWPTRD